MMFSGKESDKQKKKELHYHFVSVVSDLYTFQISDVTSFILAVTIRHIFSDSLQVFMGPYKTKTH